MNYQIRKMPPNHHFVLNGLPLEPVSRTYQYRKIMKPMLERKRRARINKCLDELKDLMTGTLQADGENVSKLEKADILELTVRHLHRLRENNALFVRNYETMNMDKFWAGFQHCAAEVSQFLSKYDQSMGGDLIKHIANYIPNVTAARAFVAAAAAASAATATTSTTTTVKYHQLETASSTMTQVITSTPAAGALAMNLSAAAAAAAGKTAATYQRFSSESIQSSCLQQQYHNNKATKCENSDVRNKSENLSSAHKFRTHPYAKRATTTTDNKSTVHAIVDAAGVDDEDDCEKIGCHDSTGVWRPW